MNTFVCHTKNSSRHITPKTPTESETTVHVVGTDMAQPYPVTTHLPAPAGGYRHVGNICPATDLQILFTRKPHQNLLGSITSPAHHTHTPCIICIICIISRPKNLHHLHHHPAKTRLERLPKRHQMPRPKHHLNSQFFNSRAGPPPTPPISHFVRLKQLQPSLRLAFVKIQQVIEEWKLSNSAL